MNHRKTLILCLFVIAAMVACGGPIMQWQWRETIHRTECADASVRGEKGEGEPDAGSPDAGF